MTKPFTGKHMAAILFGGFGIVFAVNFGMASLATRGFGGVVVENSYVASQKYNGWLEQARRTEKLGYAVSVDRDSQGRLAAIVDNAPANAKISAELRRPLGQPEMRTISLQRNADGRYLSRDPLPSGRWIARITVDTGSAPWIDELEIK